MTSPSSSPSSYSAAQASSIIPVGVVIPTYRRPALLREAIQSVVAQSAVLHAHLPRFQPHILVVDDCPDQSAKSVIDQFAAQFLLDTYDEHDAHIFTLTYQAMPTPTGGNPSKVRNFGLATLLQLFSHTNIHYIHFMDDDDRLPPATYFRHWQALDANPDAGFSLGRLAPFGEDMHAVKHIQHRFQAAATRMRMGMHINLAHFLLAHPLFSPLLSSLLGLGSKVWWLANLLYFPSPLTTPALFFRTACLTDPRVLDVNMGTGMGTRREVFDEQCLLMHDLDLALRAVRIWDAVFIDVDVLEYRTGAQALTTSASAKQKTTADYRLIYDGYQRRHGVLEMRALQLVAKTLLRPLWRIEAPDVFTRV